MAASVANRSRSGRRPGAARPAAGAPRSGVQKWAEGSCLVRFGDTQVLCAATIEDRVPPHLRGKGTGWVTATYEMLPRATAERSEREAAKGKVGGRTHEIQRLIGRSLRGVIDLARIGERTITVDCDVLVADGGTRTASITGGYIALAAALITYGMERHLIGKVAAVSVGIVDGVHHLDLDYSEDSRAEVDFNVVGTDQRPTSSSRAPPRASRSRAAMRTGSSTSPTRGCASCSRRRRRRSRRSAADPRADGWQGRRVDVGGSRKLVVATRSAHKLGELRELLALDRAELVSLDDVGAAGEPEETGETFEANAALKARFYARLTGLPTLADDSGLEVDALDGGPGVRTKRYSGPDATDATNNAKLLATLDGLPAARRAARYVCVLALALPAQARAARWAARDHRTRHVPGPHRDRAAGLERLRLRPRSSSPRASRRVAGRSGSSAPAEKNRRSHRAAAARRMAPILRARGF